MKANPELSREESDNVLDLAILAAKSESSPPDVKNRVIEKAVAFNTSYLVRNRFMGRWFWRILASSIPVIAAACVIIFLLLPSTTIGWEEVVKTVKSQKWVRTTLPLPYLKDKQGIMWLSPQRQVWAYQDDNRFIFFDGRRQEKYEYHTGQKQIVKMLLSEEDAQRILPVDYMSQGSWMFGTENLVSQKRREIIETGKKWIDFDIVFRRGEYKFGTLRVDPENRLPVYILLNYSKDATKSIKYTFDYPTNGPADIYALGVPDKITIDDQIPIKECQQVLRAMAASRARIGNFRLVVAVDPSNFGVSSIMWRKGDRWRIDMCDSDRSGGGAKPPDGLGWGDSAAEKLKLSWRGPNLICDGRIVYKNTQVGKHSALNVPGEQGAPATTWQEVPFTTPQELLSGKGDGYMPLATYAKIASLLYPDLTPVAGWGFEFDPHPADAPSHVMIKRSAHLATTEPTVAHEWFYLDPTKGYAVVRIERFNLPANASADPSAAVNQDSHRMEDFQKSPQGFWYPKSIHYKNSSQNKSSDQKAGSGVRSIEKTVHYHFDFGVELPDSLFVIDHANDPKK